ncbi:MAG: diaminopimelate epimerase [Desulfomonilaceae bacterium]|nr:diaminopimelate epimerase [Desulfomonilaceae bacterium]
MYPHRMEIKFQKMHGTRNDFIVFHDLTNSVELSPDRVAAICDRRAGVGADGVIVVRSDESADFFMDYMNSDGSLAEMCGNGIRCLAKYAYDNGLTRNTTIRVRTRAGIKMLRLFQGPDGLIDTVRVDMGRPVFDPALIPVDIQTETLPIVDHRIEAQGRAFDATIVSMGNPHCVIFVHDDPEELPVLYGPTIERHSLFPARTNVEFVRVIDRTRILMRVWERGSGETFACGTGACAAVVAARLKELVDPETTVHLKGGDLLVEWQTFTSSVLMSGPSVSVYNGTINI